MMNRRRALMGQAAGSVIPSGYVTNGLVFFLDALRGFNGNTWTDIVGGKAFSMTDCAASGNGVVFNGTSSKGVYDGTITTDCANETIETAVQCDFTKTQDILCQPLTGNSLGISLRAVKINPNEIAMATQLNATQKSYYRYEQSASKERTIGARDGLCVVDKTKLISMSSSTPSTVVTTTIGARSRTAGGFSSYFVGTIYAIRIYNRKLTEAEMKQNQQADIDRYGITI